MKIMLKTPFRDSWMFKVLVTAIAIYTLYKSYPTIHYPMMSLILLDFKILIILFQTANFN